MWTPWGPGEVSCIKRCSHFRGKLNLRRHILGHNKESLIQRCPYFRSVLYEDSTVFCAIMRMRGHKPKGT